MSGLELVSLKQRVLRAGGWTLAGYGVSQAIRLGSSLIMTRLLAPEMFGVMAIATIVMVMLSMMSDLGLSHNIVQSRRGEDPDFLDTAWVVQIVRGVVLWGIALALSGGLYLANRWGVFSGDSVYASPILPLVVAASAFSAVIGGFLTTGVATAQRNFDQKRLVQIEIASQLVGLGVMMLVGFATRSIWALVLGGLASTMSSVMMARWLLNRHRDRFRCDRSALRELISFGKWTTVSSIFTVLAVNGDRLLLGGLVDSQVLGMYAIAVLILGAIEGALSRILTAVSLPALSEVARNEPARLREMYYKLRVPGDLGLLFAAGFLFYTGQLVIEFLYDPRYAAAGGMLEVLALSFVTVRYSAAYHVYLAVGKPRYLAIINFARSAALFAVVPILYAMGGTMAAVWGIALHALAMLPFVFTFNARLGINDARRELLVLVALPVGMAFGRGFEFIVRGHAAGIVG